MRDRTIIYAPDGSQFIVDRFCDIEGLRPNYPMGKPYFMAGRFYSCVEDAQAYLNSLDWREPTEEEMEQLRREDEANYRQYMYGVEYACGIRD